MAEAVAEPGARRPLLVANCSGFYGDRRAAAREMVEGGPIDVLTGDYLAELTMLILAKARARGGPGYARTFLAQLEEVLGTCTDRGIKVVANAGGLDPAGLATVVRALAERLGLDCNVAHVEGDDLIDRLGDLRAAGHDLANLDTGEPWDAMPGPVLTANAYLGGFGIAAALAGEADVVVTGRVTDASLVVGPAAWWHGWTRTDLDRLAGAMVAGHAIECGPQVTGGNYSSFIGVEGLEHPGFPIAEIAADGSSVITKHPGSGGVVTVGTVTAQLLYEIGEPAYAGPDATARFDSIRLDDDGADRVRISGVVGEPPPADLKVCVNCEGGWRNQVTFVLTGLDVEAKAALAERALVETIGGRQAVDRLDVRFARLATDDDSQQGASALLTVTASDADRERVGRAFSGAAIEQALASYPGFFLTSPPGDATAVGIYWPTLVPADEVEETLVHADGRREAIPHDTGVPSRPQTGAWRTQISSVPDWGPTRQVPLGALVDARSGDKGGNANVGVWVSSDAGWTWLREFLTADRLRALVPEAADLEVRRYELPNLRALNFVVVGLLDRGVAETTRWDPQAKALCEWLRSRPAEIPTELLEQA